jgi:hypothetical protein
MRAGLAGERGTAFGNSGVAGSGAGRKEDESSESRGLFEN